MDGNHYLINDGGNFPVSGHRQTPTKGNVLSESIGFGDFDRDGDLDAVIGNWFYGFAKHQATVESTNFLHFNHEGQFTQKPIEGLPGETLSILLSDIDLDGKLDLIVIRDRACVAERA